MEKIHIKVENMPLLRYADLLVDGRKYTPVVFRGSGMEGKDLSIVDGKSHINVNANVVDLYNKQLDAMKGYDNRYSGEREQDHAEKPIFLHFSITPFCDKFSLQLELKRLGIGKRLLQIGTKSYSCMFGIERFDYNILDEFDDIKINKYIDQYLDYANEYSYEGILINVPGGIDTRIKGADSSNFIKSLAKRKICLCILSVPYCYDIWELKQHILFVKKMYQIDVEFVNISNIIVDWSKTIFEEDKIDFYTIKKDDGWRKKTIELKKKCDFAQIIDVDNPKDVIKLVQYINKRLNELLAHEGK